MMARKDWAGAQTELVAARDVLDAAGHGDRAFAEHNLGLVAQACGDHAAALAAFATAGEVYATTVGAAAPEAIRLGLDRARSELALGRRADADRDASAAHAAATAAGIPWIADDAAALLAHAPPPPARPVVAHPIRAAPVAKPASPPSLKPRRDVGVYGPSVTF